MGGVILATLGIPEVMDYTKIIGTPGGQRALHDATTDDRICTDAKR